MNRNSTYERIVCFKFEVALYTFLLLFQMANKYVTEVQLFNIGLLKSDKIMLSEAKSVLVFRLRTLSLSKGKLFFSSVELEN